MSLSAEPGPSALLYKARWPIFFGAVLVILMSWVPPANVHAAEEGGAATHTSAAEDADTTTDEELKNKRVARVRQPDFSPWTIGQGWEGTASDWTEYIVHMTGFISLIFWL